jgi:G3E family GTPase
VKLPIPLTVLTGFLGSGKTTLLNALLTQPEMAGTAVIVNEFGNIGLDDALIATANDETILLPSGCVCCAVRGDLVEALNRLYRQMCDGDIPEMTRVILETSGLADPAPIAHTLMTEDDLFRIYQLDGIVVTADTQLLPRQLDDYYETAKQIAVADRIVMTKTDQVDAEQAARVEALLRDLNPAAEILTSVKGAGASRLLTGLAAFEPVATKVRAEAWLADAAYAPSHACSGDDCTHSDHAAGHRHTHGVQSFALVFDEPLDGSKLSFAMELLRMTHGDKLLRLKAIVAIAGEPLPFVVHGVQHVFYPPTTLDAWPSKDRRSRFVFITKDLSEAAVVKILEPLLRTEAAAAESFYTP